MSYILDHLLEIMALIVFMPASIWVLYQSVLIGDQQRGRQ